MKEIFLSDRINRIARIFSQLPEEAEKAQSASGEGFRFLLFFRKGGNKLSCRSC